jgi:hypothetical protein
MDPTKNSEAGMNFLSVDLETGDVHRIFGCTYRDEAEQFVDENHELLVLSDRAVNALKLQIIED